MKKITLLHFFTLAIVFIGVSTMAQTKYLLDFNFNAGATYQSTPNWNNWNATIALNTPITLVSNEGVTSSINIQLTSACDGANEWGVAIPGAGFTYPGTAMMDAIYKSGTTPFTFEISGLDPSKLYSFEFFGSRKDKTDNRTTDYTCTGINTATGSLDASSNSGNLALVNNISPTSTGIITITVSKNAANNANYTYLNFLTLTETTPVAPQVLLDAEDGTTNKLTLNVMGGVTNSNTDMTVVDNPNPSGINTSSKVVKFDRNTAGDLWGGFWSPVVDPDPDFTTNKYVHVKVLKTRISPIKFKIQGGAAGDFETTSVNAQTQIGVWEDVVFDFSSKTGTYPTVVFMPDYFEPAVLEGNIVIYFDDIIVNNIATPTMAIQDNYLDGRISLYPNPSNGFIHIESLEDIQSIQMFSVDGRQVAQFNGFSAGTNTISIENIAKGMYFVNFTATNGAILIQKIIKE